jgi:hypothetical protein
MLVTAVWRKVLALVPPDKPRSGDEKWPNPHGYYDGVWWHQIPESERLGFLEGYIGCMSRDVKQPSEGYSRSASYYDNRIWSYLDAHPKAMNEAIANILSRYRDLIERNYRRVGQDLALARRINETRNGSESC